MEDSGKVRIARFCPTAGMPAAAAGLQPTCRNSPCRCSTSSPSATGQTSADAVAASIALAERADALGLHRFWLAEHHNMPSVASTNPPVLLGVLAGRTRRIRLGSGGVMLPNHAPFVIAEQFAALEAAAPGRIDLGIGRAPGSDPVITALLRSEGHTSDVDAFPNHIRDIEALISRDGAGLRLATGEEYTVRATPAAAGTPDLWLLGSSDYSAELAGRLGLPYVFAHHFSGQGTEHALDLYRSRFEPSEHLAAPRTFLTANVVAADTARGGGPPRAAAAAAHGPAPHRHAAHRARHRRAGGDGRAHGRAAAS